MSVAIRQAQPAGSVQRGVAVLLGGTTLLAAFVVLGLYSARVWSFTDDDAFIQFRYSKMLATGNGPTFNAGLAHVEGYTSVLWMLIMAIPHAIGITPILFAKGTGLALTVATMGTMAVLVDRQARMLDQRLRLFVATAPALLLAVFVPTAVHAVAGLETPLYTFDLTLFLTALALYRNFPPRWAFAILPLLGLLVGLSRPEGNLAVVVGLSGLMLLVEPEKRRSLLAHSVVLYVLPGLAYFLWRIYYYGHVFPLAYYLKLGNQSLFAGRSHVESLVRMLIWLLSLALIALWGKSGRRLVPSAAAALALLVFYLFPEHITGYEWRFVYPVVPFGFALAAIGTATFLTWWTASARKWSRAGWLAAASVALLVTLTVRNVTSDSAAQLRLYHWDGTGPNAVREEFGRYLALFQPPPSRHVLVMRDAGATPYYSGWRTVDMFGLNDNHILFLDDRQLPHYILSYHSDLIVITNRGATSLAPQYRKDRRLVGAAYRQGLRLVLSLRVTDDYYYWLLARPNTALATYLKAWRQPLPPRKPRPAGDDAVGGA